MLLPISSQSEKIVANVEVSIRCDKETEKSYSVRFLNGTTKRAVFDFENGYPVVESSMEEVELDLDDQLDSVLVKRWNAGRWKYHLLFI
jgi:hypothetical protein